MTARVYVSLKQTVLDPQGQTIRAALASLGHTPIELVRQGKFFEITVTAGTGRAKLRAKSSRPRTISWPPL